MAGGMADAANLLRDGLPSRVNGRGEASLSQSRATS